MPIPTENPNALIQQASNLTMELAETPPNTPQAKATTAELLAILIKLGQAIQMSGILPETWQKWAAAALAIITLVGATFFGTKINPPAPVDPPVIVKPAEPVKRVTYVVAKDTDLAVLKTLPSGAVEMYPVGTVYSFKGVILQLPVAVTRDIAGVDLEVKKIP